MFYNAKMLSDSEIYLNFKKIFSFLISINIKQDSVFVKLQFPAV